MNFFHQGYEILEEIGEGGAGRVYKAYHKNLRKTVVIKQLKAVMDDDIQRVEVDILKNLHHSYLPQVFDFFIIDHTAYTVMDYIAGESLKSKIDRGEHFSEKQVLKYAKQICEALAYLHSRSLPVIHGDIKPDNIMITPEDNVCLIDFNISGISRDGKAYTFGCTRGYAAPEQMEAYNRILAEMSANRAMQQSGPAQASAYQEQKKTEILSRPETEYKATEIIDREAQAVSAPMESPEVPDPSRSVNDTAHMIPIDKRCDVYSLGATLYQLYTGHLVGDKSITVSSSTSEGFVYFLNKALETNPDKRFQDGQEMLKTLNNLHKYNRSYKQKVMIKALVGVFVILLIFIAILSVRLFNEKKVTERNELYESYIEQMYEYAASGEDEDFERTYNDAVALFPDRMDAYYSKAIYLYDNMRYEDCISYIKRDVLDNPGIDTSVGLGNIYYLLGDSLIEMGDHKAAITELKNALKYDTANPAIYVDLSIAYARKDDVESAQDALDKAEKIDDQYPGLHLARGEMFMAEKDYDSAVSSFEQGIDESSDDYMAVRGYIMLSRALSAEVEYSSEDTESLYDRNIEVLKKAIESTDIIYNPILLERLTQVEIDAYTGTSEARYADMAIESLKRIDKTGTATFSTYNNLLIMYYYAGRFSEEKELLDELTEKYSDNYVVYLRYAQYELAVQSEKDNSERDYHDFESYYLKAKDLYEKAGSDIQGAPEIQALDATYEEVVSGHWLD